jgi:hypothetical protein
MNPQTRLSVSLRGSALARLGLAAALLVTTLLATAAAEAGTVTVVLNPVADATILEENPDASDAKSQGLFAGRTKIDNIRRPAAPCCPCRFA